MLCLVDILCRVSSYSGYERYRAISMRGRYKTAHSKSRSRTGARRYIVVRRKRWPGSKPKLDEHIIKGSRLCAPCMRPLMIAVSQSDICITTEGWHDARNISNSGGRHILRRWCHMSLDFDDTRASAFRPHQNNRLLDPEEGHTRDVIHRVEELELQNIVSPELCVRPC